MFEALFILTTIDAGTRIGRFLLQEVAGKWIHPKLGETGWWPGAIGSTLLIVAGWAVFMNSDSFATIWTVFGIANQLLAVIALAVVSAWLANEGRAKYLWVTVVPIMVVIVTTTTAGGFMIQGYVRGIRTQLALPGAERNVTSLFNTSIQLALVVAMLTCGAIVILGAARRIWDKTSGPGSAARKSTRDEAMPLAAQLPVEPVA
jgi:carbon starvation protein